MPIQSTRFNTKAYTQSAPLFTGSGSAPTTPQVHFGSISDELKLQIDNTRKANTIQELQKDYGAGVTGKQVLSLIVELAESAERDNVRKNEQLREQYEQAKASYEEKSGLSRFFSRRPKKPYYENNSFIRFYDVYRHYETPRTGGFILGGFEKTPMIDAVGEAMLALKGNGLISFDHFNSGSFDCRPDQLPSISVNPEAKELLKEVEV